MMNRDQLYTPDEAGTVLGLSVYSVKKLAQSGAFPNAWRTKGTAGHWRIPAADVEEHINKLRKQLPKAQEEAINEEA